MRVLTEQSMLIQGTRRLARYVLQRSPSMPWQHWDGLQHQSNALAKADNIRYATWEASDIQPCMFTHVEKQTVDACARHAVALKQGLARAKFN